METKKRLWDDKWIIQIIMKYIRQRTEHGKEDDIYLCNINLQMFDVC